MRKSKSISRSSKLNFVSCLQQTTYIPSINAAFAVNACDYCLRMFVIKYFWMRAISCFWMFVTTCLWLHASEYFRLLAFECLWLHALTACGYMIFIACVYCFECLWLHAFVTGLAMIAPRKDNAGSFLAIFWLCTESFRQVKIFRINNLHDLYKILVISLFKIIDWLTIF